jgi:hypothetical protein
MLPAVLLPVRVPAAVRWLVLVGLIATSGGCSCSSQGLLGLMPGVVNDPENLSLRRAILEFGTDQMCLEVYKRSIPLRLREADPVIGRFYTTTCATRELANHNLLIQFGGQGYAWSNVTQRIGFSAGGAVEYEHDFRLDGSTMYIYFRERSISAQTFEVGLIERPTSGPLAALQGDPTAFTNTLGNQVMAAELSRGFTVIRDEDGSVQFGLGIVPLGERPAAPYERTSDERVLYANERTEIHQNQRDYAGPYEVPDDDMALFVTMSVEGAPAIDLLAVPRSIGDPWLQSYLGKAAAEPPPAAPYFDEPVYAGTNYRRAIKLPKGLYYLVIDNTSTAGQTAPTSHALDDRAALVSMAVELGDAP